MRPLWLLIGTLIGIGYLGWAGYALADPALVVYGPECPGNVYTLVMPKAPAAFRIITGLEAGDCVGLRNEKQADLARTYCATENHLPSEYARHAVPCEGPIFCVAPPVLTIP